MSYSARSTDNSIGEGTDGLVFVPGDGTSPLPATVGTVAVGSRCNAARTAVVTAHRHPRLEVDWVFGAYGSSDLSGTVTVGPSTRSGSWSGTDPVAAAGYRWATLSASSNGAGSAWPRPILWAHPDGPLTSRWARSRTGQPGEFWLSDIDVGLVASP